ncbi:MAG: TolC family protein [Myxococcota bacterium]
MPRSLLSAFTFLVALATLTSVAEAQRRSRQLRVAVVADQRSVYFDRLTESLREEVGALIGEGGRVVLPDGYTAADGTGNDATAKLDAALASEDVDVVIGLGPLMGLAAGRRDPLPKPVILPWAVPELQGLPREGNRSGRSNLAYVTGLFDIERDLTRFLDVVRFENVVAVVDEGLYASVEGLEPFTRAAAERAGVGIEVVRAQASAAEVLAALPEDTEAVHVGPLFRFSAQEMDLLIAGLIERSIPSFTPVSPMLVDRGILATTTTEEDRRRRVRRIALGLERLLEGDDPRDFSVRLEPREELRINVETARRIGRAPRFAILTEAKLVGETRRPARRTETFESVIHRALEANLDLRAASANLDAQQENLGIARGFYLPNIDLVSDATWTDPDVANPFGQAERQWQWGLQGSQVLYSPGVVANVRTQREVAAAADGTFGTRRLDVVLEALEAYLNVLRAQTAEGVQRENLARARVNLNIAEVRQEIGTVGREEVFRWQITIAESRAAVIDAIAARNQAEIELNRVLNRPLEESFALEELSEAELASRISDPRIAEFVDDPASFRIFRDFLAEEAVRRSPELMEIERGIAAQEEALRGQRTTLYAPDVALVGGFNNILGVGGTGSEDVDLEGVPLPGRDFFSWNVGLNLSFNIIDGGTRYAEIRQRRAQLLELEAQRASLRQRIEQRIRANMHAAGASRPGIALARQGADAALANLELVTDAYRRGAVDVIRLVDAQNQALTSELAAANAVYDFLVDYVNVSRAAGSFDFERTPEEQDALYERLSQFAAERRQQAREAASAAAANDTNDDGTSSEGTNR